MTENQTNNAAYTSDSRFYSDYYRPWLNEPTGAQYQEGSYSSEYYSDDSESDTTASSTSRNRRREEDLLLILDLEAELYREADGLRVCGYHLRELSLDAMFLRSEPHQEETSNDRRQFAEVHVEPFGGILKSLPGSNDSAEKVNYNDHSVDRERDSYLNAYRMTSNGIQDSARESSSLGQKSSERESTEASEKQNTRKSTRFISLKRAKFVRSLSCGQLQQESDTKPDSTLPIKARTPTNVGQASFLEHRRDQTCI